MLCSQYVCGASRHRKVKSTFPGVTAYLIYCIVFKKTNDPTKVVLAIGRAPVGRQNVLKEAQIIICKSNDLNLKMRQFITSHCESIDVITSGVFAVVVCSHASFAVGVDGSGTCHEV